MRVTDSASDDAAREAMRLARVPRFLSPFSLSMAHISESDPANVHIIHQELYSCVLPCGMMRIVASALPVYCRSPQAGLILDCHTGRPLSLLKCQAGWRCASEPSQQLQLK
jgi:hypothetical protein